MPLERPSTGEPDLGVSRSELGDFFEPLLREACAGRLGAISWFRTDWQRGGAKTGRATFATEQGEDDVVVKIPIGPVEYLWNNRLQQQQDDDEAESYGVTPRLYASETTLGEYDLAWMVIERLPQGPLFSLQRHDAIELMADVIARFHRQSSRFAIDKPARQEDWHALIDKARGKCKTNMVKHEQRWRAMFKTLHKRLDRLVQEWEQRTVTDWCHGDVHPLNAMSRSNRPEDPALLIDLANVHAGHWVEDAVYLERIYWPRRAVIEEHPPVRLIARHRKKLGMPLGDDYARQADIRRALLAATAAAFLRTEGSPAYLEACLDTLERVMARL